MEMDGLTPTQRSAVAHLEAFIRLGPVVVLEGEKGYGRTTTLLALHKRVSGRYLSATEFVDALPEGSPLALEEAFGQLVGAALRDAACVLVDDFDLMLEAMTHQMNPRRGFIEVVVKRLCAYAQQHTKHLIFATDGNMPEVLAHTAYRVTIQSIDLEDYQALIQFTLPSRAAEIDAAVVFRAAPKLNLHMLHKTCRVLEARDRPLTTDDVVEYLSSQRLVNDVDLSKVVRTDLRSMRGLDHVIDALETHVVLPLENETLAAEFNLQPKRGVLLVGPPGTGKTTIGKALAHRLRGRFFLLDGSAIAGTNDFFARLMHTFQQAQQNAPSVIFVDDSDVLFGAGNEGIYRYFLTQLDGLEGKRAERVCVVMTAMGVEGLPPALIRSGRLELWLELELPDEQARRDMFRDLLSATPEPIASMDIAWLGRETAGFSGADVRRVVEDAKLMFAYGRSRCSAVSVEDVFKKAIDTVVANKEKYAQAMAAISATPAPQQARSDVFD